MTYEITGKLIEKFDTVQISERFKKREFVIETTEVASSGTYNEAIKFELLQDKCDILNSFDLGDTVTVLFNLKGRKWEKNGKVSYFNSLEAWGINKIKESEEDLSTGQTEDDLPF